MTEDKIQLNILIRVMFPVCRRMAY